MAPDERELWRGRIRRAIPAVALIVAGGVVAIATGGSTAGKAIAMTLAGIALVWLVSLVFYEIGLSEDRDRAAGKGGGPYDRP